MQNGNGKWRKISDLPEELITSGGLILGSRKLAKACRKIDYLSDVLSEKATTISFLYNHYRGQRFAEIIGAFANYIIEVQPEEKWEIREMVYKYLINTMEEEIIEMKIKFLLTRVCNDICYIPTNWINYRNSRLIPIREAEMNKSQSSQDAAESVGSNI